ncbi:PIR Superfamily Protein [Plasmodium ovale curtisi]|uniref:PIR Superfamily Protein n=1 Tax=Plasmodium ovale curtisi TaxID=864141 RepID=A0A1A8W8C5_PLAOA|nr:PIR Superfamily Protein [Plasmodium ovale curtisi]
MQTFLGKRDLSFLPSNIYYGILERSNEWCEESIGDLRIRLNTYIHDDSVTEKIIYALCGTSYKNSDDEDCIERCEYLFYWIGETLFSKLKNSNKFPDVTSVLYDLLKKFGGKYKCNCTNKFSYGNISEDNFKEMKQAYSYYKDFEHFRTWITHYKQSCDIHYKKHVQEAFNAYNKIYDTCYNTYEGYCRIIKDLIPKFFSKKYDEYKCTITEGEITDALPELSDLHSQGLQQSPEVENESTTAILISILLPLLGIVFFALYKFTPLGLLLHSYLLKKRVIQSSIHEEESLDFLSNEYEHTDRDSFMKKCQIGYHPTRNNS